MGGRQWDIFCRVIDNYGDIGVCWRLARQLAHEHGLDVRLWVDDLHSFARLDPGVDPALRQQRRGAIDVRLWSVLAMLDEAASADVMIEAFGCGLPEALLEALARRATPPVWINLEYLSAEAWVADAHGLPSPHPRLPLVRHFYFPGPDGAAGGLLAERELQLRRKAFQADAGVRAQFWQGLGLMPPREGEQRISMFGYPGAPLRSLLEIWAAAVVPTTLLIPEGQFGRELDEFFGAAEPGTRWRGRDALTLQVFSFLHQDEYDRLLWACDINFVRGEDSLVRALWAGRPLVWQIYPQEQGAHRVKLEAFFDRLAAGMPDDDVAALRGMWQVWNSLAPAASMPQAWHAFLSCQEAWRNQAQSYTSRFLPNGDLAGNLLRFVTQLSRT